MTALLIQYIWIEQDKNLKMEYRKTLGVSFEYLYLIIFSIIILKFQLYIHQIISLIVIYICLIIFLSETTIYYKEKTFKNILINIAFFGSTQLFFCIENVLGKKYLITYFDNIYFFMFKIGTIGLIAIVSYDIIVEIFFDDKDTYHGIFTFFRKLSKKLDNTHFFLLDIFFGFLWQVSLWLTIYYFSPLHFIIIEVIGDFFETTIIIINKELIYTKDELNMTQKITFFIAYPFIFFFFLVFFEIIILNVCKLNYNTKIHIMLRQKIDGNYDVDKSGKLVPVNNGVQSTILNDDEEEDEVNNNDPLFQ